jgi:hypothetical protein
MFRGMNFASRRLLSSLNLFLRFFEKNPECCPEIASFWVSDNPYIDCKSLAGALFYKFGFEGEEKEDEVGKESKDDVVKNLERPRFLAFDSRKDFKTLSFNPFRKTGTSGR